MLTHHAYGDLGGADHGWLNGKHHFSFANYVDPQKMSHGELLVINDDLIAPATGFDPHPHRDMEIITYVRRGGELSWLISSIARCFPSARMKPNMSWCPATM